MILCLAAAACGGSPVDAGPADAGAADETEVEPQATDVPAEPTSTPEPTAEPTEAPAMVIFQNVSGFPVCGIYLIPSDQEGWGENLLGGSQIPDGGAYEVGGIPPGVYDTLISDCEGNAVSWWIGSEIPAGASGDYPINTPVDFLTLVNNSSLSLCGLYAVPVGAGDYPRNLLLEGQEIPSSGRFLAAFDPGDWNIRIESCRGDVIEDVFTVSGDTPYTVND
jgi:hypothetical protein